MNLYILIAFIFIIIDNVICCVDYGANNSSSYYYEYQENLVKQGI